MWKLTAVGESGAVCSPSGLKAEVTAAGEKCTFNQRLLIVVMVGPVGVSPEASRQTERSSTHLSRAILGRVGPAGTSTSTSARRRAPVQLLSTAPTQPDTIRELGNRMLIFFRFHIKFLTQGQKHTGSIIDRW